MNIAFCGLGIMGSRMAVHLLAEHDVTVWTHTPGKATAWAAEHGGRAAQTPAEAAVGADVIITMVVDGAQVLEVLTGPDGAAEGATAGALVVDMSTIGPDAARATAAALQPRGLHFVDAPVTGSSPKAADGTLTIMCGGREEDVTRARPLLETMGSLIVHAGPVGQGQLVKVINNTVAAANLATAAQALIVGSAAGADLDALVAVMSAGSGGSAVLSLKAQPLRDHDFTTLFKADHMLKDVRLCLEEARRSGVSFEAGDAAAEALDHVASIGAGDLDFAAMLTAFEERSAHRI